MSMISAQCDQLRELALWLDDEFYDAEATKVRDAADTILSLRDMAQVLRAENAKLRGARDVWQENDAKLRELIADLWEYIHIGTAQDGQSLHDRTRELGIEVDE
jgi:hypothetical protein